MPIDDRTSTQNYPKPNIANTLADDVGRLRTALDDIDTGINAKAPQASPVFTGTAGIPLGSASAPSLYFTGDPNTGLSSPGADQVAISTGGTARLFVNSTGLVGISEPTPLENLHIAAVNPGLMLEDTSGGADEKYWRVRTVGSILRFEGVNDAFSASTSWLNVTRSAGTRFVDNIAFITGGSTERARYDATGRLLMGTSASRTSYTGNTTTTVPFQMEAEAGAAGAAFSRFTTGVNIPAIHLQRGRGTAATPIILNTGDEVGRYIFSAHDGARWVNVAAIGAVVSGTPAVDTVGGFLSFNTNPGAAANDIPVERLRITSTGKIGLATAAPAAIAHVGGNTIVSNVDVANATYDSVSFSVATEEINPQDIFFSPDGRKMFVMGSTGDDVNEYTLSTPWVVSSASYVTVFSVASQENEPRGLYFRTDGLKMYIVGLTNDTVYQYALTTPWSIATASYESKSFSISLEEGSATGLDFKPDGLSMYVIGSANDTVYQYTLSTAWDISTASLLKSFSVTGQETLPNELAFTLDGSRLFVLGNTGDDISIYTLTTPWDVATASHVTQFSVSAQDATPTGFYIKPDGTKLYVVGTTNDTVYQYTIPSAQIDLTGTTNLNGDARVYQNLTVDGRIIGSGQLVLATTDTGSASTERFRITNDGVQVYNQAAPAAVDTTATLTVANLKTGIITSSTAAAVTMTLPTGTDTEAGFSGIYTNMTFEWSVINTGATNAVTVQGGTGHTLVGSGTVAASTSGRFASRRTASNTFVTYRLSS